MPSLRQLRAEFASLLLIDAASSCIQVGWLAQGENDRWETSAQEAGVGVFECIATLGADVQSVHAFVFCEGPGSILGIRTVAMALRTWNVMTARPLFAYQSLAVVAHALDEPAVTVIADARRETWHVFQVKDDPNHPPDRTGKLQRLPTRQLTGQLVTPEHFRHWSELPADVRRVPYMLAPLWSKVADVDLFRATAAPDAFMHEEPSYVTWTPQIHRAP